MKKIISILTLALLAIAANAQETCVEKLFLANNYYESGKFKEAIDLASGCVESENLQDQWQAHQLLAKVYLASGQRAEARKHARKMMELNPTYIPSKAKDPTDLIRMLQSFKVIPKYTLGFAGSIGINTTIPKVLSTYNGASYTKTYKGTGGWQAGMIFGYTMNEIIELHTGLSATRKNYEIDYSIEGNTISLSESNTYLNLPVFARFQTSPFKKVRYFADIGVYTGRLLSSNVDVKRHVTSTGESTEYTKLNAMNRRNKWEYGSIFGAGIAYRFSNFDVALDAKYYVASFYNLTNTENRYSDDNLFYKMYYLDDDLRLNNYSLSVSVLYNINYKVLKDKK